MTNDSQNLPNFDNYKKNKDSESYLKVANYRNSIFEAIEETKQYILQNECKNMNVDISGLNMIDALKVCVLSSTFHFAKYPEGKIKWFVKDSEIQNQINLLKLDNTEVEVRHIRKSYVDTGFSKRFQLVK